MHLHPALDTKLLLLRNIGAVFVKSATPNETLHLVVGEVNLVIPNCLYVVVSGNGLIEKLPIAVTVMVRLCSTPNCYL